MALSAAMPGTESTRHDKTSVFQTRFQLEFASVGRWLFAAGGFNLR
jgi:hypothetical protein